MDMAISNNLSTHDVWQWLGGGWFWYELDNGARIPAKLIESEEDRYEVCTLDGDYMKFSRKHIFPHWPRCGAINLQDLRCAAEVVRRQARQYRRTYNSRCIQVQVPRKWDAMKRDKRVGYLSGDDPYVIESVFTPEYVPYGKAVDRLGTGWISVAINPYLIIAGVPEEQLVYYRGTLIGTVLNGKLVPLDPRSTRARRVLKWFDGRVA